MQTGKHWLCSWNPQFHTIKHRVTKIVPKRHREGHTEKSHNEEARTSTYEQPKHTRVTRAFTYGKGNAPLKGCIWLLLILNSIHNSATYRRWARFHSKTPPARKPALLITCESAAAHHTAEQYSKTGRTKLQKDLRKSDRSWNTYQDFLMIPSFWAAALEKERRCFSKVILASNVTPNITRSAIPQQNNCWRINNCNWNKVIYFKKLMF